MSLSNGTKLPNPFDLNDSHILDKLYLTHLHDDDKCDKQILFHIVSNVLLRNESQTRLAESKAGVTGFQPEFRTLKLVSCQMITTPRSKCYVHQTTMWILRYLKTYSWDAKALVALAAFTLGLIMEVFLHIHEWAAWSGVGYDTLEVPSLSDALEDISVAVYWIIASIAAVDLVVMFFMNNASEICPF